MKTSTKKYRVKTIKNSNKTIVKYYDGLTEHLNGYPKWRVKIADGLVELKETIKKLNSDGYVQLN